jgi:beta-lactamase superfamily II metal-dependent hydrolase
MGPTGAGLANAARDAGRIMAAATDAGLTQIDHLITTHWHSDHYGGMAELATRIPIRHFIDHGANAPDGFARARADEFLQITYPRLYGKATRTVVRPGDRVSVAGLDVLVVTSAGETLRTALAWAGEPNAHCAAFMPGVNNAEDPLSVGTLVSFGRFRAIHLGDLTKHKEFELMCPNNRIGTVDVLLGLHHGVDSSNSEVLVHALRPRVAIMNNGTRKGGPPEVMQTVHAGGADVGTPARIGRTSGAGSQRDRLLDQGVGSGGWVVHGDEWAQRVHQDLRDWPQATCPAGRAVRCG